MLVDIGDFNGEMVRIRDGDYRYNDYYMVVLSFNFEGCTLDIVVSG